MGDSRRFHHFVKLIERNFLIIMVLEKELDFFLREVNSLPKIRESIKFSVPSWTDDRFQERLMRMGCLCRYFKISERDTETLQKLVNASLLLSFHGLEDFAFLRQALKYKHLNI